MDLKDYDKLLDEAYEKIPEDVKGTSRFEIPKVKLRYEGKNTYITNFNRIYQALNRSPKHFMSIFLKTAGTRGKLRGNQLFLMGEYKANVLNKLIKKYAKQYVICDVCNAPDTKIVKEGKKQFLQCTACGAREEIE
ncbi:MAG: Translation initiation factor 2 subunit beta [Promethearchaeota archaeon]|nr:MAG: Translation initiation factor 2 subunit beta [Candidatus Lokiarchaeota archaeon]